MVWKSVLGLLALLGAAAACGCRSPQDPSAELRHASYAWCENLFAGNKVAAKRQTFVVFSGGAQFRATLDSATGTVHGFTGKQPYASGLAVGIEPDGYLVTAAHVLSKTNFVLGWFDGKVDLRSARVVFKRDKRTDADFALIKADGRLDHCAIVGQTPTSGDRVYAIVCYRKHPSLTIDFAGGKFLGMGAGSLAGSLHLIETDVPLARGDSGGPLLSSGGQLIGINTLRKQWSYSYYPDREFIQQLIKHDRSSRASNKATGPNAGGPCQLPMQTRWATHVAQFWRWVV